MRGALAVLLTFLAWAPAGAGELIFANGNRLAGELSNEVLMVSTGSGLVEVAPDEVVALSREEIRLRDGRVIRGTLIGGHVKARTSLGEIAVKVDDLQVYRGSAQAGEQTAVFQPGASTSATLVTSSAVRNDTGIVGGLPTMTAYQDTSNGRRGRTASLTLESQLRSSGRTFEVMAETGLYRDALYSSSQVGRVAAGQQVSYVDSIDRRLRILNVLVFDGGSWVKVRLPDGTVGWVPADSVREVR